MSKFYYDLHIHSCLSPCGDNDATPNNIAGMGKINGLDIMALTDHNSCKNCPSFFDAASKYGITAIAGMELTTAEDIHIICLFPNLESAMCFDSFVDKKRIKFKNNADIFGNQFVLDNSDNIICEEEYLLINATEITIDEAPRLVEEFNGICYPAHIDRSSNGIISVLGGFPASPVFTCAELHDREKLDEYVAKFGENFCKTIISSDAHYLWDIKEKTDFIELDGKDIPNELIKYLKETV